DARALLRMPRARLARGARALRGALPAARVPAGSRHGARAAPHRRAEGAPRHPRPARDPARARPRATATCFRFVTSGVDSPAVPEEITCLIVDDHEVVREGLRLSLSRAPHIRIVGEASDGASAVALAERRRPDVVIMDVRMPGMDGLEATKLLTEKV